MFGWKNSVISASLSESRYLAQLSRHGLFAAAQAKARWDQPGAVRAGSTSSLHYTTAVHVTARGRPCHVVRCAGSDPLFSRTFALQICKSFLGRCDRLTLRLPPNVRELFLAAPPLSEGGGASRL